MGPPPGVVVIVIIFWCNHSQHLFGPLVQRTDTENWSQDKRNKKLSCLIGGQLFGHRSDSGLRFKLWLLRVVSSCYDVLFQEWRNTESKLTAGTENVLSLILWSPSGIIIECSLIPETGFWSPGVGPASGALPLSSC